jgi:hypothetical protein
VRHITPIVLSKYPDMELPSITKADRTFSTAFRRCSHGSGSPGAMLGGNAFHWPHLEPPILRSQVFLEAKLSAACAKRRDWPKAEIPAASRGLRFLGITRRRGGRCEPSMTATPSPASAIEASPAVAATKLGGSV